MTDCELMQQALKALEWAADHIGCPDDDDAIGVARKILRERLAQPEQEFTTHEEGEDGWSDWVCPDPQNYLMKCCDCGLVHEAQFGVVRYKSETEREDCEKVDDPNLQAVFRMRRSEEWTPDDTAYRPGGLAQPEPWKVEEVYKDGVLVERRMKRGPDCEWERLLTPPRREWQGLAADSTIQTVPAQGGLLPAQPGIRGGLAHDAQNKEKNA